MSLPSVRSSSTLTPIENLDHHENVSPGVTQRNNGPLGLTDPSGNPIFVHTQEKSVLENIVLSQSDNSIIEPAMLQFHGDELDSEIPLTDDLHIDPETTSLQKARTKLPSEVKNAWKINNLQDVISNKRTNGYASLPNDSIVETDNAVIVGNDRDIKSEVDIGTEELIMYHHDEDANSKNNVAFDKGNARKEAAVDRHENALQGFYHMTDENENTIKISNLVIDEDENTIKRSNQMIDKHENTTQMSSHIIDGSEHNNNYSESIFDSDFYDDTNNNDRKDFSVDESFLESDAVSSHSRRATLDSTKLFKVEPTKSRRSSVYHDLNGASDHNLHEIPPADEKSIKVARDENPMTSKRQDSTSLHLSLESEDSGEEKTHNGGNTNTGFGRKSVEDDGNENDEKEHQDVFFLDMLKDNKPKTPAAATLQNQNTHGDEKLDTNLNISSDSINTITYDKSTTNTSMRIEQQYIQKHAMANIKLADFSEEQIKAAEAGGINYTKGEASTEAQSIHSGDNVYGHKDVSITHPETRDMVDQHDSSDAFNTEPTEEERGRKITVPADDNDKYMLSSNGDENRKRSPNCASDVGVEGNESDLRLDDHSKKGLLLDATEQLKATSEVKVNDKENITDERKVSMYLKLERFRGKEGSKSNSKSRDQSKEISKSASETLPKRSISNRQSNYKSIVEMKALDRLLTGPYSENLRQKTPSPRRGTYGNATKASTNRERTHKQNRYIKTADVDEDNQTSKPATSETNDRVSSSRKNGANSKKTGSAKSTLSNPVSYRSIITAPLNEARLVKAGADLFVDNKTVPDTIKKSTVSTHQNHHNQAETTTEMTSELPALESEKRSLPTTLASHTFEKAATTETATEKNAINVRDESVGFLENVKTSMPENILEENTSILVRHEQPELRDNDNNIQSNQGKLELAEQANLPTGVGVPREQETQANKEDKLDTGKKSTQLRDWSMTRAKIKASLPQLVRTNRTMQSTEQTNGRDQVLDVKGTFAKTIEDTNETVGSATKKIEEPSYPKARDVKETVKSATKKTEQHSNAKIQDIKNTVGSATKKSEEPSNRKTQATTETVGSATKRTEEPRNPKIRDTKETVGSATKKTEESSNTKTRDARETMGSATKKTEEPPNIKTKEAAGSTAKKTEQPQHHKTRDTKETAGSATKKTEEPPNPETEDTQETKKPVTKKTEELSTTGIQDTKETTEAATKTAKESLVSKTQDIQETSAPTTGNTEEPPVPADELKTPPASIAFVDETLPPQTQPNFLIDQVILQDILQKCKTKPTSDYTNSPTTVLPNGSPGSPPSEPLIGNGVNKFQDRSATKSVSIHSLTVPGIQPNTFSGDPPLDEDTISIYSRRDSVRQSFDSGSRKSVDYRIRNTALVVLPTTDEKPKSVLSNDESFIKNAIPFLPMKLAVLCLILNIVIPGSGTALSGLAILFCGQPRVLNKDDQILITLCANCMVGVAQLCTITFLLVGWFWSVSWGIEMVILSVQHERNLKEERTKEIQSLALNAFGSPKRPPIFGI